MYIAGPITRGDQFANVAAAIKLANRIRDWGGAPLCPHLTFLEHMFQQRPWEHWIETDLVWVRRCDALFRMPGLSDGADVEMAEAERLGIPVFVDESDLCDFLTA